MADTDITDIAERVMKYCNYKTYTALARALNMSPQNFNSQKKTGGIKDSLILYAIEKGANPEWIRTGQGDMTASPAKDPGADQITLRDLLNLHQEIHKLAAEIGDIKTRMIDAAQTGDLKRLGILGGKGN